MSDPDRVRGYVGPREPTEPREVDDKLDPEKFKKVMKIDETDEMLKKRKRNLRKEEEEGEDEDLSLDNPQAPNVKTSFNEFMDDKEKVDSLFDAQRPSTHPKVPQEENLEQTPYLPPSSEENLGTPPPEEDDESYFQPPPSQVPAASSRPAPSEGAPPAEGPNAPEVREEVNPSTKQTPSQKQAAEKKKKETDASLLANKPLKGSLKTKKRIPQKGVTRKLKKAPEYITPPPLKTEEKVKIAPPSSKKIEEETPKIEKEKIEQAPPLDEISVPLTEKDTGKKITEAEEAGIEVPIVETPPLGMAPLEPPAEISPFVNLPPEVFEIFERMVGVMVVEKGRDLTKTTVTVNLKDSIFNGCEIVVDHYASAPNSFNIQLKGSPEAIALFNANSDDLFAAFKQSKLSFDVNLQRPTLQRKYRVQKREGGATGGKSGQ